MREAAKILYGAPNIFVAICPAKVGLPLPYAWPKAVLPFCHCRMPGLVACEKFAVPKTNLRTGGRRLKALREARQSPKRDSLNPKSNPKTFTPPSPPGISQYVHLNAKVRF